MDWTRYETALDAVPHDRRDEARRAVERLVDQDGRNPDEAVQETLARYVEDPPRRFSMEEIADPDVSLGQPHGPEGESHGGRGGRDPLQFVEDSTPAGTNAYSQTRASPAKSRRTGAPFARRGVREAPPLREE